MIRLPRPHPQEWLALDEGERIDLAEDYHRRVRVRHPNQPLANFGIGTLAERHEQVDFMLLVQERRHVLAHL